MLFVGWLAGISSIRNWIATTFADFTQSVFSAGNSIFGKTVEIAFAKREGLSTKRDMWA